MAAIENRRSHRDTTPRCLEAGHPTRQPQLRNQLVGTSLFVLQLPWSAGRRLFVQLPWQE